MPELQRVTSPAIIVSIVQLLLLILPVTSQLTALSKDHVLCTAGVGKDHLPAPSSVYEHCQAGVSQLEIIRDERLGSSSLNAQVSTQHSTAAVVHARSESDLAKAISSATGPSLTTILLPVSLILTQGLPDVTGPVRLLSAGSSVWISCSPTAQGFTALNIVGGSFSMTGISWAGCSSVLNVTGASQVTINHCSFEGNNSPAMSMVRA